MGSVDGFECGSGLRFPPAQVGRSARFARLFSGRSLARAFSGVVANLFFGRKRDEISCGDLLFAKVRIGGHHVSTSEFQRGARAELHLVDNSAE